MPANPRREGDADVGRGGAAWAEGPPHAEFAETRHKCPVQWTDRMEDFPEEGGFWSLMKAEHIREASLNWEAFSSETGGVILVDSVLPPEIQSGMFIAMDPPRHDRIKALFQTGFTPKRISEHEEELREIVISVLDRLGDRTEFDLGVDQH
ncbi:MAG: cytochrome P450, partial [Solirubrobacterales bacterium]